MPTQLIDWSSGAAPLDKGLGDPFAGTSAAEKLGEGCGSQPLRGDRNQQGKDRLALTDADVRRLLNEANHASEPPPESAPQTSIRARSTVTRTLRLALAAIDSRPRFDTLDGTKPLEVRDDIGDH